MCIFLGALSFSRSFFHCPLFPAGWAEQLYPTATLPITMFYFSVGPQQWIQGWVWSVRHRHLFFVTSRCLSGTVFLGLIFTKDSISDPFLNPLLSTQDSLPLVTHPNLNLCHFCSHPLLKLLNSFSRLFPHEFSLISSSNCSAHDCHQVRGLGWRHSSLAALSKLSSLLTQSFRLIWEIQDEGWVHLLRTVATVYKCTQLPHLR